VPSRLRQVFLRNFRALAGSAYWEKGLWSDEVRTGAAVGYSVNIVTTPPAAPLETVSRIGHRQPKELLA